MVELFRAQEQKFIEKQDVRFYDNGIVLKCRFYVFF